MISKTSETSERRKTLERASEDQLPPLRLTQRDRQIINAVYTHRMLTTSQIGRLLFSSDSDLPYGGLKRCQHRLKLLFHHGYLYRDEQPIKLSEGRRPLIYTLDDRGIKMLAGELKLERKVVRKRSCPQLTATSRLRHLKKCNDVRITITLAAQDQGVEIKEWLDDYDQHQDHDRVTLKGPLGGELKVAVIPDAYFWLWTGKNHYHQCLEVDLGSVVGQYSQPGRKDWSRRIKAYKEYYHSGLYQKRYPEAELSFRVLTVTMVQSRRAYLKEITERVAGKDKKRFWFADIQALTRKTALTGEIWHLAGRTELHPLVW
jgi:hypothetical protein